MFKIIIISENQYLATGLMGLLNQIPKNTLITRTSIEYLADVIHHPPSDNISFKKIILCDKDIYNVAKHKLRDITDCKIIEIPRTSHETFKKILNFSSSFNDDYNRLSSREYMLCELFKLKKTDEQISLALKISKKTISSHRRNIISKLNLKNRQQLYLFCRYL